MAATLAAQGVVIVVGSAFLIIIIIMPPFYNNNNNTVIVTAPVLSLHLTTTPRPGMLECCETEAAGTPHPSLLGLLEGASSHLLHEGLSSCLTPSLTNVPRDTAAVRAGQ